MKKIFLISSFILFGQAAFTQSKQKTNKQLRQERINQLIKKEEEGSIIFNKQWVAGGQLNSDGYGAFGELMYFKTPKVSYWYRLELGEHKSNKEEKVLNSDPAVGRNTFIYGKINNFFYAKLGFGQQYFIGNKGNKNGVAVSLLYGGGLSAGLLKPYVLEVVDVAATKTEFITYDPKNPDIRFLYPYLTVGSGGFLKGWDKLQFRPGVYGKVALRFDYGRYNETVSALEAGINWEIYKYGMPIMLGAKAQQFLFNAYVAVMLGHRR